MVHFSLLPNIYIVITSNVLMFEIMFTLPIDLFLCVVLHFYEIKIPKDLVYSFRFTNIGIFILLLFKSLFQQPIDLFFLSFFTFTEKWGIQRL